MVSSQPLLANSGLKAILALGEIMVPHCEPRISLEFIWVCLILRWGSPD
jgi:hypothetical protein